VDTKLNDYIIKISLVTAS